MSFISQNGRPDEKYDNNRKTGGGDTLVNNGAKWHFYKNLESAMSLTYNKFPIRMRFRCEAGLHSKRTISETPSCYKRASVLARGLKQDMKFNTKIMFINKTGRRWHRPMTVGDLFSRGRSASHSAARTVGNSTARLYLASFARKRHKCPMVCLFICVREISFSMLSRGAGVDMSSCRASLSWRDFCETTRRAW